MNTKRFWFDTAERAVKTFFQSLGSLLVAGNAFGVLQVEFRQCAWVALISAGASICTSIGSSQLGDHSSASILK